ncbi:Uncharacterized protein PBTT_00805 [Plasmodiophora brassicae]|uniref:Uncharacterized protein n=1 Tax=Plasmodiophora brassicae TaxID=37360 RepID=A0A3P3XYU5_PLABS|nr:unnamed protein product [Plasmodiophora brassicae]
MAGLFVKLARRDGVAWTVEDGRRSVSLDCSEGVRLVVRYDSGEAQLAFDVLDPAVQKSICLLEGFPKIIIETPSDRSSAIELTVLSGQVPAQLPIQIRERADSMVRFLACFVPCRRNSIAFAATSMFAELDDRLSRLSRTPAIAVDLRGVSSNSLAAALDEAAIHERIGRLDTDPQFRQFCNDIDAVWSTLALE